MLLKRYAFAFFLLIVVSTLALGQKADLAFVVGGSFVSDSKANVLIICPGPTCPIVPDKITTSHQVVLEGVPAARLLNLKAASLHLEVPFAGLPSQKITLASNPSNVLDHLSSIFITPSLRLKLLPGALLSPSVSFGGGWAHYSLTGSSTSKGALQYGGGLDIRLVPHFGLRFEVRDFVSGDPNFGNSGFVFPTESGLHRHNVLAGGGGVLNF